MVRKGYIQQQIEGLAQMLAHLLGIREKPDVENVLDEIRNGAKSLTGMDLQHLMEVPEPLFLALFQSGFQSAQSLDAGKAAIIATLLIEEADEIEHTGSDDGLNMLRRQRAHMLLGAALAQEPFLRTPEMMTRLLTLKRKLGSAAA